MAVWVAIWGLEEAPVIGYKGIPTDERAAYVTQRYDQVDSRHYAKGCRG